MIILCNIEKSETALVKGEDREAVAWPSQPPSHSTKPKPSETNMKTAASFLPLLRKAKPRKAPSRALLSVEFYSESLNQSTSASLIRSVLLKPGPGLPMVPAAVAKKIPRRN